jgi:hypothetical protein
MKYIKTIKAKIGYYKIYKLKNGDKIFKHILIKAVKKWKM